MRKTILLFALLVACGGEDTNKPVKYPGGGDGGEVSSSGGNNTVETGGGQQIGVVEPGPDQHADMDSSAKSSYEKGFKAWANGDLQGAKAGFKEATEKDNKSAAAFYSLGCVLERLGENSGAQQAYRSAFSVKSDYELAMGAYALNLARTGHIGEADTFLNDKVARMPNSARMKVYYAEVKSLNKDSAGAQQLCQDALRVDSTFKDAMVEIARDYQRAGRGELAKYALQAVLDGFGEGAPPRDPENAEAHLIAGLIDREAGRRLAAIKHFEAARAKRPDLVEATIQLGAMKLEGGNGAEAQQLLESAVKFAPQSPIAHLDLGDCYRLLGRLADAKKEYDQSLALDSSLLQAHYNIGLMYLSAPSYPGMSEKDKIAAALKELNQYKTMRGPKAPPGVQDDIDELIDRATRKQSELNMASSPPLASAPTPAASAKPDGGKIMVKKIVLSSAFAGMIAVFAPDANAQGRVITISEVTIVGRVQKPIAAVDVNKIPPKLTLSELRQPFLDRIEQATVKDPF